MATGRQHGQGNTPESVLGAAFQMYMAGGQTNKQIADSVGIPHTRLQETIKARGWAKSKMALRKQIEAETINTEKEKALEAVSNFVQDTPKVLNSLLETMGSNHEPMSNKETASKCIKNLTQSLKNLFPEGLGKNKDGGPLPASGRTAEPIEASAYEEDQA